MYVLQRRRQSRLEHAGSVRVTETASESARAGRTCLTVAEATSFSLLKQAGLVRVTETESESTRAYVLKTPPSL